ncbi:hypothetical protein FGO68_gene9632 [Halteria grandinella]|uniref:Uncharacterized protein n=1 Tax=Halteria grandinella TaxID=5974 RepID=A0A8J8SZ34_HALGN|nr:hypothetical protein FGO68_gene9632 [Halteria grandinella]
MQVAGAAAQEDIKMIKLIIMGQTQCGKTRLISEITSSAYIPNMNGMVFRQKDYNFEDGGRARVMFWDPCGQDRYDSHTRMYTRGSQCAIVCFDVTDRESFDKIEKYMKKLEEGCTDNLVKVLVGNKSDLMQERKVFPDEGEKVAEHYNCKYFETSAETGENVQEMAGYLIKLAYEKELEFPTQSLRLMDAPIGRGGGICWRGGAC